MTALVDVIATYLARWAHFQPHVEVAAFGTAKPDEIAGVIDETCRRSLGAKVAAARFYESSIGAVAGVELVDGRIVVVKVHQPEVRLERLRELARVRACVPFSPPLLADPIAIATTGAYATIESFADGERGDARDASTRHALAIGLRAIIVAARPLVSTSTLDSKTCGVPGDRLWPTPHSKLFDFQATATGAEHIDAVARAARAETEPCGELVIAHGDWRVEHVRFANGSVSVAYDWDSLCLDREPAIVGYTAHAFTADWSDETNRAQAPTLDDARGFVADYELARGRAFDRIERRLCAAAFTYACAYTARCSHALGVDERLVHGTFAALVAQHGPRLLEI